MKQPKFKETSRLDRWKTIIKIAWPLIIANSFWNLQLTVDRIYLGGYSTESLGAALTVMGIFWTPMALLQQTASYVMTFVAQYFGAKKFKMIGPAVWQAIYLCTIGGLLFLFFIPFAPAFFNMVGHASILKKLEIEYFSALCFSALPTGLVAAASGFYTGLGQTRTLMLINCVGLVANAILAYLFIFGWGPIPNMGIAGAGYATALANLIAAVFALYLVFSREHEKKYKIFSGFKWNSDLMWRFIRFGLPSGAQWALEGMAFTVFLIIVGRMENGSAALAASGIVVTIMMLAILPPIGIAQAVSVLVGQHVGEKKPHKAVASTWSGLQVALMFVVTMGLSFLIFPQFYLNWFHNAHGGAMWLEVSKIVPYLLMFVALFICFDCVNFITSFALKGAGDTKFVSLVVLLLPWPIMVLPTYLMRDWHGALYWGWAAAACYSATQSSIFLTRFWGGKWKKMSVIN